jgi:hypothetical protein
MVIAAGGHDRVRHEAVAGSGGDGHATPRCFA